MRLHFYLNETQRDAKEIVHRVHWNVFTLTKNKGDRRKPMKIGASGSQSFKLLNRFALFMEQKRPSLRLPTPYLCRLFEAAKRFGLPVLSYLVTSNHVHLLDLIRQNRIRI